MQMLDSHKHRHTHTFNVAVVLKQMQSMRVCVCVQVLKYQMYDDEFYSGLFWEYSFIMSNLFRATFENFN